MGNNLGPVQSANSYSQVTAPVLIHKFVFSWESLFLFYTYCGWKVKFIVKTYQVIFILAFPSATSHRLLFCFCFVFLGKETFLLLFFCFIGILVTLHLSYPCTQPQDKSCIMGKLICTFLPSSLSLCTPHPSLLVFFFQFIWIETCFLRKSPLTGSSAIITKNGKETLWNICPIELWK